MTMPPVIMSPIVATMTVANSGSAEHTHVSACVLPLLHDILRIIHLMIYFAYYTL